MADCSPSTGQPQGSALSASRSQCRDDNRDASRQAACVGSKEVKDGAMIFVGLSARNSRARRSSDGGDSAAVVVIAGSSQCARGLQTSKPPEANGHRVR